MHRLKVLVLLSGFLVTACAGVRVTSVTSDAVDAKTDGFRYYETATFLIVSSDGKGGVNAEIKQICDTTKKRAADPYTYLANNNTTLDFDNGCLTGEKIVVDETPFPKAIVEAVKTVATAAAGFLLDEDSTKAFPVAVHPAPAIYRMSIENGFVVLRGGPGQGEIRATISQPAKQAESGE